jgi:hypothetical protein
MSHSITFVSSSKGRMSGDHITLSLSLLHVSVIFVTTAPVSRVSWVKHPFPEPKGEGVERLPKTRNTPAAPPGKEEP